MNSYTKKGVCQLEKPDITIELLVKEAIDFCKEESIVNHKSLYGVTDGKAVGTYVEHKFEKRLEQKYSIIIGNSAVGIDLPDPSINTDIKVTSIKQPQSSCPYKDSKQKIFGLGYNLLVFVYDKVDHDGVCNLLFTHCTFIDSSHTSDYTLTRLINEHKKIGANQEDIIGLLRDKALPGDEITLSRIAEQILSQEVKQGYLTISNALQWRLQYKRVIELNNTVEGVKNYVCIK